MAQSREDAQQFIITVDNPTKMNKKKKRKSRLSVVCHITATTRTITTQRFIPHHNLSRGMFCVCTRKALIKKNVFFFLFSVSLLYPRHRCYCSSYCCYIASFHFFLFYRALIVRNVNIRSLFFCIYAPFPFHYCDNYHFGSAFGGCG